MWLHAACNHLCYFFLGHVVRKLCSIVFFFFLLFGLTHNTMCAFVHAVQMKMEAFLSIQALVSPRHSLMLACSLANTHICEMVIVWGSFSIFSPHHMRVSGYGVCTCAVFIVVYFALASPLCNFNGIWSICSWSFLQFVLFSSCALFFLVRVIDFSFICFKCDPAEGHLPFNFTIWNIYVVQVKKCQHES